MQDPVIAESIKIAWTEGKAVGFIPSSIFIKDESADPQNEKPVYFLQEFGFRYPAWRAIDEYPFPEATIADYYDMINYQGRWHHFRYFEGWRPKGEDEDVDHEAVVALLAAAGLDFRREATKPKLHLVPDWVSQVSHDEHLELIKKEKWASVQAFLETTVRERCRLCADGKKLYGDGYRFFHRKDLAFARCAAEAQHEELETKAWVMFSNVTKSQYRLLRGHIDRYSRLNSSRKLIRSHDAFRKLVDMGPEAVPFILNDLKKGRLGGIWSAEILADLTGKRGKDPQWWLSWAEEQGYDVGFEA